MANWYLRSVGGDTFNSSSYTLVGTTAPPCPGANSYVCAILADDNGSMKPVLTPALQTQMEMAISTNTDQPNVLVRSSF